LVQEAERGPCFATSKEHEGATTFVPKRRLVEARGNESAKGRWVFAGCGSGYRGCGGGGPPKKGKVELCAGVHPAWIELAGRRKMNETERKGCCRQNKAADVLWGSEKGKVGGRRALGDGKLRGLGTKGEAHQTLIPNVPPKQTKKKKNKEKKSDAAFGEFVFPFIWGLSSSSLNPWAVSGRFPFLVDRRMGWLLGDQWRMGRWIPMWLGG